MPSSKNRIHRTISELSARFTDHPEGPGPIASRAVPAAGLIRMLRLAQVINMTGLGKTKLYELQSEGDFPMRVHITPHTVGWIEHEVQMWLANRAAARMPNTASAENERLRQPSE